MRKERKWERNRNVEKLETLRKLKLGFSSDEKRKKVRNIEKVERQKSQGGLSSENKRKKRWANWQTKRKKKQVTQGWTEKMVMTK